jgi:hypothetical protein
MLGLARSLALFLALIAGVLFLVLLVAGIFQAVLGFYATTLGGAVYFLIAAFVNYLVWRELPALEALARNRQYAVVRERLLVWVILGFIFFVVEGIILLLVWLKVDGIVHPPPPMAAPMAASPPPSTALWAAPSAAATPPPCPRCGGPTILSAEYRRYYCTRCAAYA